MMLASLAAALILHLGPCPTAAPQDAAPTTQSQKAPAHLTRWPGLAKEQAKEVVRAVAKLKKASSEAMLAAGLETLERAGAGAAPELLRALAKEKKEAPRARLIGMLEKLTGAEHTRLLSIYFKHKSDALRHWSLRRCALFPDPGTLKAAQKALQKALNPGKRKEVQPDEVFVAALAACAAGDLSAMEHLEARAKKVWKIEAASIQRALSAVRGKAASTQLVSKLGSSDRKERLVALRFLTAAGVEAECVDAISPFLDDQDNELLVAAINALRSIVNHEPPLPRLSAFDAITKAKEWKAKL